MKPTITGGLEKLNPMKVLTYDETHEDVSKSHNDAYKKMSMHKTISDVIERAEKEKRKMVERK